MRAAGWRRFFQAMMVLVVSAAIVFSMSRGLSAFSWLRIYQNQFTFTPGDWFAWRLNDAQRSPANTCILVGASTVREGLSSSVLQEAVPNTKFVNLATTGGQSAIDAIEVQARILASRGDRYECILVGLHPIFLRKFDQTSYDLVTTDYLATLSLRDLFDLGKRPWTFPHVRQIAYKYFIPFGQQSLQLKRLIRLSLYNAHRTLIDPTKSPRDFEESDGEFLPQSQSNYAGQPDVLKDIEESYPAAIKQKGWDRPDFYGGRIEASALHHALRLLSGLTDRLFVLELPESHLFKNVEKIARAPYEAALASSNVPMIVVRCKISDAEEFEHFHDAVHLNERGRNRVSRSVAQILEPTQQPTDDVCQIRTQTSLDEAR